MTVVGVISDIHANIDALEAVFLDMKKHNVSVILCTGDIVGYHTFPDETVKSLRASNAICIRGNHDNDVVNRMFNCTRTPDIFRFTYDNLSDESLKWLENLPFEEIVQIENVAITLSHGSPNDIEEYLFENSEEMEKYAIDCKSDVLLSGHTHFPCVVQYGSTLFVNSGSVGKPKIGRPVATWADLTIDDSIVTASIHEVSYCVENVATASESAGFESYALQLRNGKA